MKDFIVFSLVWNRQLWIDEEFRFIQLGRRLRQKREREKEKKKEEERLDKRDFAFFSSFSGLHGGGVRTEKAYLWTEADCCSFLLHLSRSFFRQGESVAPFFSLLPLSCGVLLSGDVRKEERGREKRSGEKDSILCVVLVVLIRCMYTRIRSRGGRSVGRRGRRKRRGEREKEEEMLTCFLS